MSLNIPWLVIIIILTLYRQLVVTIQYILSCIHDLITTNSTKKHVYQFLQILMHPFQNSQKILNKCFSVICSRKSWKNMTVWSFHTNCPSHKELITAHPHLSAIFRKSGKTLQRRQVSVTQITFIHEPHSNISNKHGTFLQHFLVNF